MIPTIRKVDQSEKTQDCQYGPPINLAMFASFSKTPPRIMMTKRRGITTRDSIPQRRACAFCNRWNQSPR